MNTFTCLTLLLWGCLLLPAKVCAASKPIQAEIETRIKKLYLDQAEELVAQFDHPAFAPYYQSKIGFIRCLARQDPSLRPPFFIRSEQALKEIEPLPDDMPLRKVLLAEIHFQAGMIHFLDHSYFKAANDLKRACDLIHRNYKEFPTNIEQLKLLGTYQVALASVPGKFRWLTRFLCFKGDLDAGIRQLEQAAKKSELLPAEAEILLFYIDKNLLNQPQSAFERIQRLYQTEQEVFVWNYFLAATLLELHKTDSALALMKAGNHFPTDPHLFFPR